jgi:phosphoserine phosphatase
MGPLTHLAAPELLPWLAQFESAMAARLPADMRALVGRHQAAGDLCAIVTATTRLIAEPFARAFGITHLVATEAALEGGVLTGEIDGEACVTSTSSWVQQWLAGWGSSLAASSRAGLFRFGPRPVAAVRGQPPVAVRPDPRLRAHAVQAGWPALQRGPPQRRLTEDKRPTRQNCRRFGPVRPRRRCSPRRVHGRHCS